MAVSLTAIFVLVGLVNLGPMVGVLSAQRLEQLYDIRIPSPELILAMRHRAVLLGLVGALLLAAALREELRSVVGVTGLVSMLSFAALCLWGPAVSPAMVRVAWVDVVASALLLAALCLHWLRR